MQVARCFLDSKQDEVGADGGAKANVVIDMRGGVALQLACSCGSGWGCD